MAERAGASAVRLLGGEGLAVDEALLAAYQHDDPAPLQAAIRLQLAAIRSEERPTLGRINRALALMFLSDRGMSLPLELLEAAMPQMQHVDPLLQCARIAQALAVGDDARLVEAIDDAEAHGLIPHAARVRIVLAQRTGDRAQLDQACPVLERLGDRQFLRRLEEVAASLE
jgi:hypothetical protein